MLPDLFERNALKNRCYDAGKSIQKHVSHDKIDSLAEFLTGEDAQVKETDRCFREIDGKFIKDLSSPESLNGCVSILCPTQSLLLQLIDLPAVQCADREETECWMLYRYHVPHLPTVQYSEDKRKMVHRFW